MQVEATYIGVATVLFRIGDLTILTDPAFDAPGETVRFGPGASSTRVLGPALSAAELPKLDAVLLSHDEHEDNLDRSGRDLLAKSGVVLTTRAGARRLGGNAVGLAPFASHEIAGERARVRVTATPARHGPPLSLPIVGHVTGFLLSWEGQRDGAIYVSGDTVLYSGIDAIAARGPIGAAFLHMGGASFSEGGMRFTMTAADAATAAKKLGARRIFPIHTDGWTHFRDKTDVSLAFAAAGLADRLEPWKRGQTVAWEA